MIDVKYWVQVRKAGLVVLALLLAMLLIFERTDDAKLEDIIVEQDKVNQQLVKEGNIFFAQQKATIDSLKVVVQECKE